MSLPYVGINFAKSSQGYSLAYDDGCTGLLANGEAVAGKIALDTPFAVTMLEELEALGITQSSNGANANVYKCVKEFFSEAPRGTVLYILLEAVGEGPDDLTDEDSGYLEKLVDASRGTVRTVMVKVTDEQNYTPTTTNGLDEAVLDAVVNAQESAEALEESHKSPLLVVLEGRHYQNDTGTIKDLTSGEWNRVAVVIGDTEQDSTGAAVGLVCGRMAAIPVHRSIARVADGPIKADAMYIGLKEATNGAAEALSDKGYICPRIFVGMDGYFWSDDRLSTKTTDDYGTIARRRTIDKAYRLLNIVLHGRLNDEVAVGSSGLLNSAWVTGLETEIKSVLLETMGAQGNLGSVDEVDDGVDVYIDLEQNVVNTSMIELEVSIMPYGYGKYIVGSLRFGL